MRKKKKLFEVYEVPSPVGAVIQSSVNNIYTKIHTEFCVLRKHDSCTGTVHSILFETDYVGESQYIQFYGEDICYSWLCRIISLFSMFTVSEN